MGGLGRPARDRGRRVRRDRRRAARRCRRAARCAVGRRGRWDSSRRRPRCTSRASSGRRCRCRSCGGRCPDWWRTFFPPHVAAFLYGIGLGPGFLTYLGHGTVVVVSVAAFASGRPLVGAAVLAPFGLARGLGPVLAFGVRSPSDGAALVERLERSASRARWQVANALALVGGRGGDRGRDPDVRGTFRVRRARGRRAGADVHRGRGRRSWRAEPRGGGRSRRTGSRAGSRGSWRPGFPIVELVIVGARGRGARVDGGARVARGAGGVLRGDRGGSRSRRAGVSGAGASVVRRPGTTGCCSPATSRSPGWRSWRGGRGRTRRSCDRSANPAAPTCSPRPSSSSVSRSRRGSGRPRSPA